MKYSIIKEVDNFPRLPLEGSIDLTYRCNNDCRHCWLWISANSPESKRELSIDEIKRIVDEARKMGCRKWFISGGEPMLRKDFAEIFDYITKNSFTYTLNTNGTLITPEIAHLMRRRGSNIIAIYGATAEVHDHVTRNLGSFEAALQGIAYLKEAKADFVIQLIPMRVNYHNFKEMIKLAESLSPHWRVGAAWLYLSASGDLRKNSEIIDQRLDPADVIGLDKPSLFYEELEQDEIKPKYSNVETDDHLFNSCISRRQCFHVDPYGQMSFCNYVVDKDLRYDFRNGSFEEFWEEFIPHIADRIRGGKEYLDNCGSCDLRNDCRWCPVYGYLEHQRYSAKVDYLCTVARENKKFKENWKENHRRYYQTGGITILVESDLPIEEDTFHPKFKLFRVRESGDDLITIQHHFYLPYLENQDLGEEICWISPWSIRKKGDTWIYLAYFLSDEDKSLSQMVIFNRDYSRIIIYHQGEEAFKRGGLISLSILPSDQIYLAPVLADREGCFLHSSGVILDGKGLLFAGQSGAGKSTMVKILRDKAEILCDDRIILRRQPEGFTIHGTWNHGEIPLVSSNSAPLRSVLFLEKSNMNRIIPIYEKKEVVGRILATLIKPHMTHDWWEKMFNLIDKMVDEIPCYVLRFDKSGEVVKLLEQL